MADLISTSQSRLTSSESNNGFDRTNAVIAALVTIFAGIVYWMTVQPTVSFWDCGEFIACSYILGIPHPPGSPLFIIIGRLFSVLPIAADVAFRVNMISVISSAFIVTFAYLINVRIIQYWYTREQSSSQTRWIAYIGGAIGALFAAFARTNWGNAVEAEVYGLTLMLSLAIIWLAMKFYESRGEPRSFRYLALAVYLAVMGVGIHMTVFLVLPVAAIFFVMKRGAEEIHWLYVCSFFVIELLLILLLSFGNVPAGYKLFLVVSAILFGVLAVKLYHHINLPWVIALAAVSLIMIGFWPFVFGLIAAVIGIVVYGRINPKGTWRSGLIIILLAALGFSVNFFIPIRSSVNPRIDENNPSKDFSTFVNFLERKQYGQESMTERMFDRRGLFENQFGRHPHMGFWSYFEEQYSTPRWGFLPFFLVGLYGIYVTMKRKVDIGYPYLILCLLTSVGLILYMNFADGIKFDYQTGDAYLEVRNRDYFFTPAFIFFGMAIGLGVAGIIEFLRNSVAESSRKTLVMGSTALCALAIIPLKNSYFENDRSRNYFPYDYARNILISPPDSSVLFTSGDNDTFPLWCLQEAHRFKRDIRVANLSLLNTDWYVEQMKNRYNVPMDLTDEQIVINDDLDPPHQPQPFKDRARQRTTYLMPSRHNGRFVKVQDIMVDEISIASRFQNVAFTSEPYAESPLKLNQRKNKVGLINVLNLKPTTRMIDVEKSYDLYMNQYVARGLDDPTIYKDDNATGIFVSFGFGAMQVFNEYMTLHRISQDIESIEKTRENGRLTDTARSRLEALQAGMDGHNPADSAMFRERALLLMDSMIQRYPEFWMSYIMMAEYYVDEGDSAKALDYLYNGEENLKIFSEHSPDNANYLQDLGLLKYEIAKMLGDADDQNRMSESLDLLWAGFNLDQNSGMGFQKLFNYLLERQRMSELQRVCELHAQYKNNWWSNSALQQVLGPPPGSQASQQQQIPTPPGGTN